MGGDEFVILMSNADKSQYELIQKRIRAVNAALGDTSDGLPAITVSAGVACGDRKVDPEEIFDHADKALYNTKRGGKNGITLFDDMRSESGRGEEKPLS